MENENRQELDIAILQNNYKTMSDKIDDLQELIVGGFAELKKDLKENYVSKEAFLPVKAVTFGLVGTVMLGFLYTLLRQVNW